jgi:NCAIR mutase (PurE)-related protein
VHGFEDLGFARVDVERAARTGDPEVVYRAAPELVAALREAYPDSTADAGCVAVGPLPETRGTVCVVAAGTSDGAVAAEAAFTARVSGAAVSRVTDVGVAGIHRLLAARDTLDAADCLVVVAGMDGALPSAVGGLTGVPLVAVPTSVGYGASFGGVAALLTMLNSCAPGVVVVNIDNGFGAGLFAARVARRTSR